MLSKLSSAIFDDGAKKKEELEARSRLVEALKQTSWVPVHKSSPSPFLPWELPPASSPVATPAASKTMDKMWLASSTYRLVDGEVHTPELKAVLGWNEEVRRKNCESISSLR